MFLPQSQIISACLSVKVADLKKKNSADTEQNVMMTVNLPCWHHKKTQQHKHQHEDLILVSVINNEE